MGTLGTRAPYLAGLVGTGSLLVGLYSFKSPLEASRVYGANMQTTATTTTTITTTAAHENPTDKSTTETPTTQWMKTLSYAHGVRNVGFGSAVIGVALLYHFEPSPVAAQAIKRCLGPMLLLGSVIPVGDTIITTQYMGAENVPQADRDVAKKASIGHALRSIVWLGAGALCLWA